MKLDKNSVTPLAAKTGRFLLDEGLAAKQDPADMYEAAGQIYVAMMEACLFAAEDPELREKIRRSLLGDIGRISTYMKEWEPPTKEEFHSKHPTVAQKLKELKQKAAGWWDRKVETH